MAVEFAPDDYRKFELDWYEAKLYCFSLNIDEKVGWRLPTIDEIIDRYFAASLRPSDVESSVDGIDRE